MGGRDIAAVSVGACAGLAEQSGALRHQGERCGDPTADLHIRRSDMVILPLEPFTVEIASPQRAAPLVSFLLFNVPPTSAGRRAVAGVNFASSNLTPSASLTSVAFGLAPQACLSVAWVSVSAATCSPTLLVQVGGKHARACLRLFFIADVHIFHNWSGKTLLWVIKALPCPADAPPATFRRLHAPHCLLGHRHRHDLVHLRR